MTTRSSRDRAEALVLPEQYSAFRLLGHGQKVTLAAVAVVLACVVLAGAFTAAAPRPLWWAQVFVSATTIVYVLVICFRCLLVAAGPGARIIRVHDEVLIADQDLPPYTVLIPLHREELVLPGLIETIHRLDYPVHRLQVLLLVEQDDDITRPALDRLELPPGFEVELVPEGGPRTKPNACNVGLARATGELCVIYDAEDRPESDQLRKAVAAFGWATWVRSSRSDLRRCRRR
ncbi:glycosyltransferase, partial [Actinosynnema sp. NPDC023658]|uniref:glycosyltransferase n=1 Tax=Actinosynnema sp. NPDC023658 TaxID=3155465 RepID=UPI0033CEF75F